MGDFCHGWRRKIGVLILLTSCFFAGEWIRSLEFADSFWIEDVIHERDLVLLSINGRICFSCQLPNPAVIESPSPPYCAFHVLSRRSEEPDLFIEHANVIVLFGWNDQWIALGEREILSILPRPEDESLPSVELGEHRFLSIKQRTNYHGIQFVIPHWFIVIPLTAISAWLLLSKPRQRQSKSPLQRKLETAG